MTGFVSRRSGLETQLCAWIFWPCHTRRLREIRWPAQYSRTLQRPRIQAPENQAQTLISLRLLCLLNCNFLEVLASRVLMLKQKSGVPTNTLQAIMTPKNLKRPISWWHIFLAKKCAYYYFACAAQPVTSQFALTAVPWLTQMLLLPNYSVFCLEASCLL